MTTQLPTIEIEQAEAFLDALDPKAHAFSFRTFDDDDERKDPKLTRILHGTLHQHAPELTRLNKLGAGVFVTINETDGQGDKDENIVRIRAMFVDLDGAPLAPITSDQSRPPHIIVETSEGRWHAYWPVEGMQPSMFRDAQTALIEQFDADKAVKNPSRVMRLPGFLHCKREPRLVRLVQTRALAPYKAHHFPPSTSSSQTQLSAPAVTGPSGEHVDVSQILDREAEKVANSSKGARNNVLNKVAYTIGGLIGEGLLSEAEAEQRLLRAADEAGLPRREAERTIQSGFKSGKEAPWSPRNLLDPSDPMRSAEKLIDARFLHKSGHRTLHRHREGFWAWNGACFDIVSRENMEAVVWRYTERALAPAKFGYGPFKPTNDKVQGIIHALKARAQLSDKIEPPAWLQDGEDAPPPSEFMAVNNGLLHLPSRELWQPTPTFFNTSASTVDYDPDAPSPRYWLAFLQEIFEDDHEAVSATQEFFGYCLVSDTSQQKILLIVGPPRSGKGTMARVLRELAGHDSVAGPTMHSLGGEFGLEPLIPRPIAIISDARIGQKTDKAAVTERLLSISGEDTLSVNRKNTTFWHGKLQTRFVILTNELPALSDGSGALANRFIIIVLRNSFLGKEDQGLFERLKGEASGILNWAIEGYERLRQRGHFVQPASGQEALAEIETLASPVKAFVRDRCEVGSGLSVPVDELWEQYTMWVEGTGSKFAGTKDWFGRNLRAAVPGLTKGDGYPDGKRIAVYKGVGLKKGVMVLHRDTKGTDDNPEIPF